MLSQRSRWRIWANFDNITLPVLGQFLKAGLNHHRESFCYPFRVLCCFLQDNEGGRDAKSALSMQASTVATNRIPVDIGWGDGGEAWFVVGEHQAKIVDSISCLCYSNKRLDCNRIHTGSDVTRKTSKVILPCHRQACFGVFWWMLNI